ncbi:glycoside hydrolase domain-containing protein [uncultured Algoriphagus sp.]|uniref:glycoside hydrolase domain-containing protein n=1 Tax=uncultured Algoriphagus sp. TaxID=417365 RepID=UPI0030EFA34B
MKKILVFFVALLAFGNCAQAQLSGYFTSFEEFGTMLPNKTEVKAWRNESLILPFLINGDSTKVLNFEIKTDSKKIKSDLVQLHLVEGDISGGNCGATKKKGTFVKKRFPDRAEFIKGSSFVPDSTTSYGLVKIEIPDNLKPGKYPLELTFDQNGSTLKIEALINVIGRKLSDFSSLDYEMDFWQFPLSISTYYKLDPYSDAHWNKITEMFDQLHGFNQIVVTTSVFYDLYNTSIKPLEQMMIQIRKKKDGTYTYDYSTFEKYVELAFSKGISKEIAVHNLFPWNLTYFYFDEESGAVKTFKSEPGTDAYNNFWNPFLVDFATYLKSKNWMDKTVFWVDERDINSTALLVKYVKAIDPAYKFGYSGRFSPGLSELVFDYSLASNIVLEPAKLAARKSKGFKTTYYTSCYEVQPNMLMASNYTDIYFLIMLSKARGYDGMLRWAFNLWSPQIMKSAIFSDLPSGDSHFVYPEGQVSLRYLIIKDALEEVQKVEAMANSSKTKELLNSHTRYFLLNIEKDRINMVKTMKNYLND